MTFLVLLIEIGMFHSVMIWLLINRSVMIECEIFRYMWDWLRFVV